MFVSVFFSFHMIGDHECLSCMWLLLLAIHPVCSQPLVMRLWINLV